MKLPTSIKKLTFLSLLVCPVLASKAILDEKLINDFFEACANQETSTIITMVNSDPALLYAKKGDNTAYIMAELKELPQTISTLITLLEIKLNATPKPTATTTTTTPKPTTVATSALESTPTTLSADTVAITDSDSDSAPSLLGLTPKSTTVATGADTATSTAATGASKKPSSKWAIIAFFLIVVVLAVVVLAVGVLAVGVLLKYFKSEKSNNTLEFDDDFDDDLDVQ